MQGYCVIACHQHYVNFVKNLPKKIPYLALVPHTVSEYIVAKGTLKNWLSCFKLTPANPPIKQNKNTHSTILLEIKRKKESYV